MIRTHSFPCSLPKPQADALNAESGRIYTLTLIWHYRIYRRKGLWLSSAAAEKLGDSLAPTTQHAHSRDAAQQGFYKACKTTVACRKAGLDVKYPHKRKKWRTTIWKDTGIRKQGDMLLLSRVRGQEPVVVSLPSNLVRLPPEAFREARLVWDRAARHYFWHLVIEDGVLPPEKPPGTKTAAVDLGEIHPAAVTDGEETVIFSARALRAVRQNTARRLSEIQRLQDAKVKGSQKWRQLQQRKNRFLAQQKRRTRDIEHKVSRAVVDWAVERKVGTLAVGDVREVANGKRLNAKSQQKISTWAHGRQRDYITYKAEAKGTHTDLEDEAYTSQTCPRCKERHKPTGRVYACPACGFVSHRDAVGAANILSHRLYGEVGHLKPPSIVKYRQPFGRVKAREIEWPFAPLKGTSGPSGRKGKRSRPDTAEMAAAFEAHLPRRKSAEAPQL